MISQFISVCTLTNTSVAMKEDSKMRDGCSCVRDVFNRF